MTELVFQISHGIVNTASSSFERVKLCSPSREVLLLGTFLAILQVLDGVLTGIGVYHFGLQSEGNLFIRHLMEQLGFVEALVLVKTIAIVIVAVLCTLTHAVTWLKYALGGIAALYVVAAIIPWTALLVLRLA